MKKWHVVLAAIAVAYAPTIATAVADETYQIDPARSKIAFKVHQFVAAVNGRFKQFSGVIELGREHPEKSSVSATIQVKSIDTGIPKRDAHLCSAEFFTVEKFPEITFKSRSVKQTGPDSGDILGDFTMHGVTKPLTLHVKSLAKIDAAKRTTRWGVTTGPLSRREFGVRFSKTVESVSMVGDEVSIEIEIEATKAL